MSFHILFQYLEIVFLFHLFKSTAASPAFPDPSSVPLSPDHQSTLNLTSGKPNPRITSESKIPLSPSTKNLSAPIFHCNSEAYGSDLNLESCQNAISKIPQSPDPKILGIRGAQTPPGGFDVILPYRFLSVLQKTVLLIAHALLADDGSCAIDINLGEYTDNEDISTWTEIHRAANSIVHLCVQGGPPSEGGIVGGLGIAHAVEVTVSDYQPDNIECFDPATVPVHSAIPSYESCKAILGEIPCSGTPTAFVPWTYRTPIAGEVRLPNAVTSRRSSSCPQLSNQVSKTSQHDSHDWGIYFPI
ncbi:hypothetical protein ACLMJK_000062 [Lecanora helva]